jgi:hypothetical protein
LSLAQAAAQQPPPEINFIISNTSTSVAATDFAPLTVV